MHECSFLRRLRYVSVILVLLPLANPLRAQVVNWVFLDSLNQIGTCASNSSYPEGEICYGIEYTSGITGSISSYTFGFIVECLGDELQSISTSSCSMDDNSFINDACSQAGVFLLQASGNDGNLPVIANQPVVLHQVCMNFHFLDSIDIIEDPVTGITVSLDTPNGPATDSPPFGNFNANYSVFNIYSCSDTSVCSVLLGLNDEMVAFDTTSSGTIVDGVNRTSFSQSFDVADEVNQLCGISGGKDDITISYNLPPLLDIYGNGSLSNSGGSLLNVTQDSNGILGSIPFGIDIDNQTSSGDVRGFDINIDFADHMVVKAGQLDLLLSEMDLSSAVNKSISIQYFGIDNYNYGTFSYNGYFINGADYTGNCYLNSFATPHFNIEGLGVYSISSSNGVDLSDPCNPMPGISTADTLIISATTHGGLHPEDLIKSIRIQVRGEDVASPTMNDDGSGTNGDDGIIGNSPTNTNALLKCKLLAVNIDGCVFEDRLPVQLNLSADPLYVEIGDTINYSLQLINRGVTKYDPIENVLDLSQYFTDAFSQNGGVFSPELYTFPDNTLKRLDNINYVFNTVVSNSAPCVIDTLDQVENSSLFESSGTHHSFTPWEIQLFDPFNGSYHWYGKTDTAMSVKYLTVKEYFVPGFNTTLSFWHNYNTQLHHDGGIVELSIDNGGTWIDLGPQMQNHGYNDYLNNTITLPGFSGNSNGYVNTVIDLGDFVGQTCLIRFTLFSDYETDLGGWSIDDIEFSNLKTPLPLMASSVKDSLIGFQKLFPMPFLTKCTDVFTFNDDGRGSLRAAIDCAEIMDTITFLPNMIEDTIQLVNAIDISKNLFFTSLSASVRVNQNSNNELFRVLSAGEVFWNGMQFFHSGKINNTSIFNEGIINMSECSLHRPSQVTGSDIYNLGLINFDGQNNIYHEE